MQSTTLLILVVAAATVVGAAAQGCPSQICSAAFANAYPAPTDCCVHDYKASPSCSWGGTPVSWRQTRTCSDSGKTYSVLVKGNFQGPPNPSAECRCQNVVVSSVRTSFSPIHLTIQLKPKTDSDISGADIACDGQKFCKVCGGLDSVKAACAGRSSCVAFTYNPLDSCGYLKAGSSLVSRKGWVAYVRE